MNKQKKNSPYTTEAEKKRLLSFFVVGGGPTSVEVRKKHQKRKEKWIKGMKNKHTKT